jgi:putative endopeptidase
VLLKASWTKAEQRDLPKLYDPMSPAELAAYAPGFPWAAFLRGAGLESKTRVILAQKTAFPKIAEIFDDARDEPDGGAWHFRLICMGQLEIAGMQ